MVTKMIDFGDGFMPKGFSKELSNCFDVVTVDVYATPDFKEQYIPIFLREGDYTLVTATRKEHVSYRELGCFEVLDGIYSKGDYFHSFFIAENIFKNYKGISVKLIALLYEERGRIHIWNPSFEELFVPLIQDDIRNSNDAHWRSILEIQQKRSKELNVYEITISNQVDYEIEVEGGQGEVFSTVVYYSLLKHIFLVEDEKYPSIPGSERTVQAYKELYNDYLSGKVDINRWRTKYQLKNPRR